MNYSTGSTGSLCFCWHLAVGGHVSNVVHASLCPVSVTNHLLKVGEHGILQTACRNFIKFTMNVQLGTEMN